jgi:hypothetical protein
MGGGRTLDLDLAFYPAEFRLIDINGDGRADRVYIHNTTTADIRINQHGDHSDGMDLKLHWRGFSNQIEGWPDEDKVTRDHVLFGKVFGSGRNDLVRMKQVGEDFDYVFHFYHNTGKGGKELQSDGVHYCDMFGRGYDEYVWNETKSTQRLTRLVTYGLRLTAQSSCSSRFESQVNLCIKGITLKSLGTCKVHGAVTAGYSTPSETESLYTLATRMAMVSATFSP